MSLFTEVLGQAPEVHLLRDVLRTFEVDPAVNGVYCCFKHRQCYLRKNVLRTFQVYPAERPRKDASVKGRAAPTGGRVKGRASPAWGRAPRRRR
jgi:hypothetical protein